MVLGHLGADWGTQAVYILIFNNYYLLSHTYTHIHTHTRARVRAHQANDIIDRELNDVCVSHCCIDHIFQGKCSKNTGKCVLKSIQYINF